MWSNKTFRKTLYFAQEKHAEQKMKWPNTFPYMVHLAGVMNFAINGCLQDATNIDYDFLIQLALLHDTLEDTIATYNEIEINFGEEVAKGVLALTKNEDLPETEQMADSLQRIKQQRQEVWIVKLADRLFNMQSKPIIWDKKQTDFYQEEAKLVLFELGSASKTLHNQLLEAIEKYND